MKCPDCKIEMEEIEGYEPKVYKCLRCKIEVEEDNA
jgi:DNA-directed RNA polymerase subunit RPC12/RpoP